MRLLLSKPDALGDQILASAFVQALRRHWPDAQIFWHVRPGMEVIARLLPEAAVWQPDLAADPGLEGARCRRESTAPITLIPYPLDSYADWSVDIEVRYAWWAAFLGAAPWDAAIAPMVNRTALSDFTVTASNADRRIGFAWNRACQPMIEAAFKHLPGHAAGFTEEVPASLHDSEWQHYIDLLAQVAPGACLVPPEFDDRTTPAPNADLITGGILIAPSTGTNPQRAWPLDRFVRLARQLREEGRTVRWVEGPADAAVVRALPESEREFIITTAADQLPDLAARF